MFRVPEESVHGRVAKYSIQRSTEYLLLLTMCDLAARALPRVSAME